MQHALLGDLTRDGDAWVASAPLPGFAAVGALPDPPADAPVAPPVARPFVWPKWRTPTARRAAALLGHLAFALAVLPCVLALCVAVGTVMLLMDLFQRPNPADADQGRAERDAADATDRLRRGLFPVRIDAPAQTPPTVEQDAAVRHLLADPGRVLAAVEAAVYDSFQDAYSQPYWRQFTGVGPADSPAALAGRYALRRTEVAREYRGGVAFLVFPVEAAWASDHGVLVVYHPDRPAVWATADDLGDVLDPTAAE